MATLAGREIGDVGVLPQVAARVLELADEPESTGQEIAAVIIRDPSLTSKLLRLINSAAFGLRGEVRSIQHAVAYLGIPQIRDLVVSSAVVESFKFDHGIVDPRSVWEHCFGCALGSKRVADMLTGLDGNAAYLGGLLHDLGRICFISSFPAEYADLVALSERGLCPLSEAEQAHFGMAHEEAGEALGREWGFDERVSAMIRWHHDPARAADDAIYAAIVGYVNAVCHERRLRFGFEIDDETQGADTLRCVEMILAERPDADQGHLESACGEAVDAAPSLLAKIL